MQRAATWAGLGWLLLCAASLWQLFDRDAGLRLQLDPRPLALLGDRDPRIAEQRRAADEFRLDEQWLVSLPAASLPEAPAAFADTLLALHWSLAEVEPVLAVDSLASAPMLTVADQRVDARSLLDRLDDAPLPALLDRAAADPRLGGLLISPDARQLGFAVTLSPDHRSDALATAEALRAAARAVLPTVPIRITGASLLEAASGEAMLGSLKRLMPMLVGVSIGLLLILVRQIHAALFCALTAFATLCWTGALIVAAGLELNLVTALLPPLLLSLAIGYGLYAVGDSHGHGLGAAALTTAAGFLALMLTPVYAVQQFAVLCALGTALVWLNCQLLLRALPTPPAGTSRRDGALQRQVVLALARLHRRHRRRLLFGAAVVAAVSVAGMPRIEAGTRFGGSLPPDSPVRADYEASNRDFGGVQRLHLLIDTGTPGQIVEPGTLHAIDRLTQWLLTQPAIAGVSSISDTLITLNAAYARSDSSSRLPPSASAARQYLWLGAGGAARQQVDQDLSKANLSIRTPLDDTAAVARLRDRIVERARQLLPEARVLAHGDTVLLSDTVQAIAGGQLPTLAAALLAIFVVLAVMFMSVTGAAVALVPNVMPILIYFGALGYGGVPLSPATSLVACIVIGLAVDNTIHYFSAFSRIAHESGSERTATRLALSAVMGPATVTTVILCAGFAVLAFDPLPDQARFGLLAAATLACAWLNDLLLTPALAGSIRIVTLWDLLTIDLGEAPEKTLPLMQGLSRRQARILALQLERRELRDGQYLITEGDRGNDFFLVVDGRLEASIQRDSGRTVLGEAGRGALIGEAGFLGQARTASVRALGDCRLLRMDAASLERLRRRYPTIAAIVYRNLHRSLAERFAANLQRVG